MSHEKESAAQQNWLTALSSDWTLISNELEEKQASSSQFAVYWTLSLVISLMENIGEQIKNTTGQYNYSHNKRFNHMGPNTMKVPVLLKI